MEFARVAQAARDTPAGSTRDLAIIAKKRLLMFAFATAAISLVFIARWQTVMTSIRTLEPAARPLLHSNVRLSHFESKEIRHELDHHNNASKQPSPDMEKFCRRLADLKYCLREPHSKSRSYGAKYRISMTDRKSCSMSARPLHSLPPLVPQFARSTGCPPTAVFGL